MTSGLVLLVLTACVPSAVAAFNGTLAENIAAVTHRPEFRGCRWGVEARRISTDELLVANTNAHDYFIPASNGKLVSTFAAWLAFGPDFTFNTTLAVAAAPSSSTVNLTLCGAGDPSLSSSALRAAALAAVHAAPALGTAERVNVRVDSRRDGAGAATQTFPSTWEWGDLQFYYGAPPSSTNVDGNTAVVIVAPGAGVEDPAVVTGDTGAQRCFTTVNQVTTGSSGSGVAASYQVLDGTYALVLTGVVGLGDAPLPLTLACHDPAARATDVLTEALLEAGVSSAVAAASTTAAPECDDPDMAVAGVVSERLEVLLNHTLLESDNTFAEAICRAQGSDGSYDAALAAVQDTLQAKGLDTTGFAMVDGSGLSRHDLVSPRFLVDLLQATDPAYIALLPLAGETGTLASRFVGTPAEGKLRAKTGTETHINALSGQVGDVSFSIISNACPQSSSVVRQGIDDIAVQFVDL